jgi:hypothetical protein
MSPHTDFHRYIFQNLHTQECVNKLCVYSVFITNNQEGIPGHYVNAECRHKVVTLL